MNNPMGVSPSKGNQGTTRGKKNLLTSVGIEPATSRLDVSTVALKTELRGRTEKVGHSTFNIHSIYCLLCVSQVLKILSPCFNISLISKQK